MFDFQKEVIINSAEVDGLARVALIDHTAPEVRMTGEGAEAKPKADGDLLSVLRCAEYRVKNIVEMVKTEGQNGTPAKITLAVPAGVKAGDLVHAEIVIGLEGKYMADYANVWSKFGKDIVVEYEAVDADAAELEARIKDALPMDNTFVRVGGGEIAMTDSHQIVKKAVVCLITKDETTGKEEETAHKNLAVSPRKREFATGAWLRENLRFPTHLNLRYDNVAGDDAPIDGATYTQYSFQYESERKGLHGQGTIGQKLTSVTTHTFYVNNALTDVLAVFDAAMAKAKFGSASYPVLEVGKEGKDKESGKDVEVTLPEIE